MKKQYWFLLIISAVFYALPFLCSDYFWWLIFLFPVPLLYVTCAGNLSFVHGYVWGCAVFALHLSSGVYLLANMAGESWVVGLMIGIAMVLYQALVPAFLFWGATYIIAFFAINKPILRLLLWAIVLLLFITWVDWYSLWIFGVKEGYPLMHPLIVLTHKSELLCLLPIVGKLLLMALFLLVPVSVTALLWYKNWYAMLLCCVVIAPWVFCYNKSGFKSIFYLANIKTLPCMVCSTTDDPKIIIQIVGNYLKKLVARQPAIDIIIMPESACNVSNFAELSELLQTWNTESVGKAIHVVFGASRWHDGNYYNALHWVYDGKLQHCYDKQHAMLMSERLSAWMNNDFLRQIYFNERQPIAISLCERIQLGLLENTTFVPYICSELFFNELPDDCYGNDPIIAIINDSLFLASPWTCYIHKLLVLLARFKAIQWQRDIVYVSYAQSLFIDRWGRCKEIND